MADGSEAITWMPLEALFDRDLRRKYLMAAERTAFERKLRYAHHQRATPTGDTYCR